MTKWLNPVELTSELVTLVPLTLEHEVNLMQAASDGELWNLWFTSVPQPKETRAYIEKALDQQLNDKALPFAVIDNHTNEIVGSTRICNAWPEHKRVEIGYTWYAKKSQKTGVNTQTKLLLLEHAFERLNCICVEFRTHFHNHDSRRAIARLGAKQDGILRNNQILPDGSYRDTVMFSIIDNEWPTVKNALNHKLTRYK